MKAFLASLGEVLKHLFGSRKFMLPLITLLLPILVASSPASVQRFVMDNFSEIAQITIAAVLGISFVDATGLWVNRPKNLSEALHQMLDAVIKALQGQNPDADLKVIDLKQNSDGTWAVTISSGSTNANTEEIKRQTVAAVRNATAAVDGVHQAPIPTKNG